MDTLKKKLIIESTWPTREHFLCFYVSNKMPEENIVNVLVSDNFQLRAVRKNIHNSTKRSCQEMEVYTLDRARKRILKPRCHSKGCNKINTTLKDSQGNMEKTGKGIWKGNGGKKDAWVAFWNKLRSWKPKPTCQLIINTLFL